MASTPLSAQVITEIAYFRVLWLLLLFFSTFTTETCFSQVKKVSRASISSTGVEANGASFCPQINDDGTFVAFSSIATNLTSENSIGGGLYVRNLSLQTTTRADTNAEGAPANFSVTFGGCDYRMSGSGQYVVFSTLASNLVSGSFGQQIFRKDLSTGSVILVSTTGSGPGDGSSQGPALSADGRYIAFTSSATNLVTNDTNGSSDVFVYDAESGTMVRASVLNDGSEANGISYSPDISSDGRYVLFTSFATNLTGGSGGGTLTGKAFIRDLTANTTTEVKITDNAQLPIVIDLSRDGRYVIFSSGSSNLVTGDENNTTDVFVYDTTTEKTIRVSLSNKGKDTNGISYLSITGNPMSEDGRYIAFGSLADNIIGKDINKNFDIFVYDTKLGDTLIASVKPLCLSDSEQGNETSEGGSLSADGKHIVYLSIASNLVSNDTNGAIDVFVADLIPPATFKSNVRLNAPNPSACGDDVSISAPIFTTSKITTANTPSINASKISYEMDIYKKNARKVLKKTKSKQNEFLFSSLPSGSYTAKFRVSSGSSTTKFSPKATFTIP